MNRYETIHTPLPMNVEDETRYLFSRLTPYRFRIPQIKEIKNAFVTHEGLVLKNGLLVNGCAFNLQGKEDNTFYYTFWRSTIEQYAVCRWGKSLPAIHLKGSQKYLLIHSKWFNYAFWINSYLLRLIMAEEAGLLKQVKLIVPEGWKSIPFVWDSLKAFDIEMEIIPIGHHLFVDNLVMPETRQWTASFYPPHLQKVRERLLPEAVKRVNPIEQFPKKIYLTRTKRGIRCVENDKDVVVFLKNYGFEAMAFEDYSIWEQIVMMSHATHFISLHGAGFSNVLFMNPGSFVLELINKPYAEKEYTFPYWRLSNAAGLNYFCQFCQVIDESKKELSFGNSKNKNLEEFLVSQNVIVEISQLEKFLST